MIKATDSKFDYRIYGIRVEMYRRIRKVSQGELAKAIGLSRVSVANIEAGRQKSMLHAAVAISKHLKVDLKKLVR